MKWILPHLEIHVAVLPSKPSYISRDAYSKHHVAAVASGRLWHIFYPTSSSIFGLPIMSVMLTKFESKSNRVKGERPSVS